MDDGWGAFLVVVLFAGYAFVRGWRADRGAVDRRRRSTFVPHVSRRRRTD